MGQLRFWNANLPVLTVYVNLDYLTSPYKLYKIFRGYIGMKCTSGVIKTGRRLSANGHNAKDITCTYMKLIKSYSCKYHQSC